MVGLIESCEQDRVSVGDAEPYTVDWLFMVSAVYMVNDTEKARLNVTEEHDKGG